MLKEEKPLSKAKTSPEEWEEMVQTQRSLFERVVNNPSFLKLERLTRQQDAGKWRLYSDKNVRTLYRPGSKSKKRSSIKIVIAYPPDESEDSVEMKIFLNGAKTPAKASHELHHLLKHLLRQKNILAISKKKERTTGITSPKKEKKAVPEISFLELSEVFYKDQMLVASVYCERGGVSRKTENNYLILHIFETAAKEVRLGKLIPESNGDFLWLNQRGEEASEQEKELLEEKVQLALLSGLPKNWKPATGNYPLEDLLVTQKR